MRDLEIHFLIMTERKYFITLIALDHSFGELQRKNDIVWPGQFSRLGEVDCKAWVRGSS